MTVAAMKSLFNGNASLTYFVFNFMIDIWKTKKVSSQKRGARQHSRLIAMFGLLLFAHSGNTWVAWRCLYKEFPVDNIKIKGLWWIYATYPEPCNRCLFSELDLYWTRITMTDYENFAIELHCSMPWYRPQMSIYTREKQPNEQTITKVKEYLTSVKLNIDEFKLVDKEKCENLTDVPKQRWHLSKYMHLDYHPHYVKPLVLNGNI